MKAELIENRLVVWNIEDSRKLFSSGFFGKPIGIPKPRQNEFEVPIILDLFEGHYLASKSEIQIFQEGKKVSLDKLQGICKQQVFQFREKLMVYEKLRNAGFLVTPGKKFGADIAA